MPGFNIGGTGGEASGGPPSLAEVRRTHRWVFQTLGYLTDRNVMLVLKTAQRPSFQFEEPAMHHNQEQIYFAGKQTWEAISLTFYDVEQAPDVSAAMWTWLNTVEDIANVCVAPPSQYKDRLANLQMVDGCGNATETWTIYNGWPQQVNWNGLDYSSTELQLIEVKYRFDRALKK
jgi:hypothetical protein